MTKDELQAYMAENPDFRRYVSEFCRSKHITADAALVLKVVENVALSYQGKLKIGETERS